jgi:hypothetical protein
MRLLDPTLSRLKYHRIRSIVPTMGKIEQVGLELRTVSHADFRQTPASLDHFIKNESQLTEVFEID